MHVFTGNEGGAIFQENQVFGDDYMVITHSTISGNSASSATVGAGVVSYGYLKMYNTILANSVLGYDCYWHFGGGLVSVHNLIENNAPDPNDCETPYTTSDPLLISLANNGGPTQTMALPIGSPAIDVADADHCPRMDQRGINYERPQGGGCDLGAFELDSYPTVLSSETADPNPTSEAYVDFFVIFNEPVTGVDKSDFTLTKTGSISGEAVHLVSGSGNVYTVTCRTGSFGSGTLRLDVVDDNSIIDDQSNALGGPVMGDGDFTLGEAYIVRYSFIYLPLVIR